MKDTPIKKPVTMQEMIKRAVQEDNYAVIGKIVDILRFSGRLRYEEIYKLFHDLTGIKPDRFEEIMYHLDGGLE